MARDVNGDDALDLIVSSVADSHVVAVLLNDGHGLFSAATLEDYALTAESDFAFRQREPAPEDTMTLAQPRSTFDGAATDGLAACSVSCSGRARSSGISGLPTVSDDLTRGRSPPYLPKLG